MDPITHTLVGATLAETGVRRFTPLAATTLILAANAPDIDIVAHGAGPYIGLALRRGITHGIAAMVVLPLVVTAVVLLLDRTIRRWRRPGSPRPRPAPILLLSFAGVLTHPLLDWLNTYGIRLLMPMDDRWFYGDALFIMDPWLWLGLGGILFLLRSSRPAAIIGWAALAFAMSIAVLGFARVPVPAKVIWSAGIVGFVVVRQMRRVALAQGPTTHVSAMLARAALIAAALYIGSMILLDRAARREVLTALARTGITGIEEVMVAPEPANPLAGSVVVAMSEGYLLGSFGWFDTPRFARRQYIGGAAARDAPEGVRPTETRAAVAAAIRTDDARHFLVWSRFPYYRVRTVPGGYTVRIGDARYAEMTGAGSLAGVEVRLDAEFRPR